MVEGRPQALTCTAARASEYPHRLRGAFRGACPVGVCSSLMPVRFVGVEVRAETDTKAAMGRTKLGYSYLQRLDPGVWLDRDADGHQTICHPVSQVASASDQAAGIEQAASFQVQVEVSV